MSLCVHFELVHVSALLVCCAINQLGVYVIHEPTAVAAAFSQSLLHRFGHCVGWPSYGS